MEKKKWMIVLYGKDHCPHCKELQKKVVEILKKMPTNFFAEVQNLSTREGLVAYAKAETINGQRIPALQICRWNPETKFYEKVFDPRQPILNEQQGYEFIPTYLQLQTDYANHHYITKEQILELMDIAERSYEKE